MPEISFIIPAFNARSFLADAIASVTAQTFSDWELIIVDDNSSDDTLLIARDWEKKDKRIRVIHRYAGSGSAFIPRFEAASDARSKFILPLDADDIIPPDYAEIMLFILKNNSVHPESTIVYPAEYLWIPPFDASKAIKPPHFLPDEEIRCRPGREAVALTLDGWRVPAAGGIIPRALYLDAYHEYGLNHADFIHADELLTRHLMMKADEVIFASQTRYYCRCHPDSITTRPTLRRLDILDASIQLIEFSKKYFGIDSEEYRRAHSQLFHWIFDSLKLLSSQAFNRNDRRQGYRRIRHARHLIDKRLIRPRVSRKLMTLLPLPLPLLRQILKLQ